MNELVYEAREGWRLEYEFLKECRDAVNQRLLVPTTLEDSVGEYCRRH